MAIFAAMISAALLAPVQVQAAGGGDNTTSTPVCRKGKVWDKRNRKCIKVKKSSQLEDEQIYQNGRDLAIRGRYDEAITVLSFARNKNDPRVLNYLGYSHRKQGRIDVGLGYYQAALRIDPDYTLVREYMGEAFLQKGDIKSARGQLAQIEIRCGLDCREYAMLAAEIDKYLSR